MIISVYYGQENIEGNGENADHLDFLLFSHLFLTL